MQIFSTLLKQLFQASFDAARRDCACTNSGDLVSIHTLEENRFIEKLAGSTEVFNFQFYSCILSTFLFQRSGLEAETLSLKVADQNIYYCSVEGCMNRAACYTISSCS